MKLSSFTVGGCVDHQADVLLLLDAHLLDSGADFLRAAAQRDLLQQVEVLHGELLPLLERRQDLTQGDRSRSGGRSLRPPSGALGPLKTTSLSFSLRKSCHCCGRDGKMKITDGAI